MDNDRQLLAEEGKVPGKDLGWMMEECGEFTNLQGLCLVVCGRVELV